MLTPRKDLTYAKYRCAVTLVHLNALPPAEFTGRCTYILYSKRTCNCDLNHIESTDNIHLTCPEFFKLSQELIFLYLVKTLLLQLLKLLGY